MSASILSSKDPLYNQVVGTLTVFDSGAVTAHLTKNGKILTQDSSIQPHGEYVLYVENTQPSQLDDDTIDQESVAILKTYGAKREGIIVVEHGAPQLSSGTYNVVATHHFPIMTRPTTVANLAQRRHARFPSNP